MKTIIPSVIILVLFASCMPKEKSNNEPPSQLDISKETFDFETSFEPRTSFLYENYLILSGKDSLGVLKILAIDIDKNKVDTTFTNTLYDKSITNLIFKNDTILARFEEEDWYYWENNWIKYNLKNEWFFLPNWLNATEYLYEDDEYIVFALDMGEFGGGINFHNKKTNKLYAAELYGANFCTKVGGAYIVNGNLRHMDGHVEVLIISDPESLFLFPDSLNIYTNDSVGDYFRYLSSCNDNILPDSIVEELNNFDYKNYQLSKEIIAEKLQIITVIDTYGISCLSTFVIDNKLVHFIQSYPDSVFFVGTMYNDSLYVIDTLYNERFIGAKYNTGQSYKGTELMTFHWWMYDYKKEKMICLIWRNDILKRYNIY